MNLVQVTEGLRNVHGALIEQRELYKALAGAVDAMRLQQTSLLRWTVVALIVLAGAEKALSYLGGAA